MVLVTRQTRANEALERFKEAYESYRKEECALWTRMTFLETVKRLEDLGDTPDPDAIDKLLNPRWTNPGMCNECNTYAEELVQIGEEPDYESRTASVCVTCLRAAMALIERARRSGER